MSLYRMRISIMHCLAFLLLCQNQIQGMVQAKQVDYEWAIIGAGPAGIVVVGLLMDLGIPASHIAWIDPEFSVGRLSSYTNVPANSTVRSFIEFLHACKTFAQCSISLDRLSAYAYDTEPPLGEFVAPLQEISNYLCTKVTPMRSCLKALNFSQDVWHVAVHDRVFSAQRVVLASGSHPRSLQYPCETEIPLEVALDTTQLKKYVNHKDSVAVVGSAHSAVLAMKFLSEAPVARIVNFYNRPLHYAQNMGSWVLYAESGLKGIAAEWAKNVLEKNPPANILRIYNNDEARQAWLPVCNKIIYAAGFERNEIPPINGIQEELTYDCATGVIAPHLFGIGIAFPEMQTDPLGNQEHRVGLNSFMAYAQRVTPEWLNKDVRMRYRSCENFLTINLL